MSTVTHFDLALFNKTYRRMISCCLGSLSLMTQENGSNEDFLINLAHRGCYLWLCCFRWREGRVMVARLGRFMWYKVKQEVWCVFSDKYCQLICGLIFIQPSSSSFGFSPQQIICLHFTLSLSLASSSSFRTSMNLLWGFPFYLHQYTPLVQHNKANVTHWKISYIC